MTRPPKILLALMKLDIGGAETHVVVLTRHLTEMGYKVVMASNGGCFEEEIARYGVKHYKVPLHLPKLSYLWRSIWTLRKIVREENIDLIHAHARIPAFVTAFMGRPRRVRFITTAHYNFDYRYGLKYISQWGEKTIAVSHDIKEYLIKYFGVRENKIVVIPNGIDTNAFSPTTEPAKEAFKKESTKNTVKITLISRLDGELANVALNLITACSRVAGDVPAFELAIVGDGDNRMKVEEHAREFNAKKGEETVTLLGARTDINRIIAASDLVVGVSRVALEAMACAKPVLLAGPQGFGGLMEKSNLRTFQEDNYTARSSIEKSSAENLTAGLSQFFARPVSWRTEIGQLQRQMIIDKYSSLHMARQIAEVYEEALQGRD
jgi:glycosyltransferase involved in cell wall biosynthesis